MPRKNVLGSALAAGLQGGGNLLTDLFLQQMRSKDAEDRQRRLQDEAIEANIGLQDQRAFDAIDVPGLLSKGFNQGQIQGFQNRQVPGLTLEQQARDTFDAVTAGGRIPTPGQLQNEAGARISEFASGPAGGVGAPVQLSNSVQALLGAPDDLEQQRLAHGPTQLVTGLEPDPETGELTEMQRVINMLTGQSVEGGESFRQERPVAERMDITRKTSEASALGGLDAGTSSLADLARGLDATQAGKVAAATGEAENQVRLSQSGQDVLAQGQNNAVDTASRSARAQAMEVFNAKVRNLPVELEMMAAEARAQRAQVGADLSAEAEADAEVNRQVALTSLTGFFDAFQEAVPSMERTLLPSLTELAMSIPIAKDFTDDTIRRAQEMRDVMGASRAKSAGQTGALTQRDVDSVMGALPDIKDTQRLGPDGIHSIADYKFAREFALVTLSPTLQGLRPEDFGGEEPQVFLKRLLDDQIAKSGMLAVDPTTATGDALRKAMGLGVFGGR